MTRLQKFFIALVLFGGLVAVLIVVVLGAAIVARLFFVDHYIIPQNGMYPTKAANSRALALRNPYESASEIRRGDIVVLLQSKGGRRFKLLWRVIGIPGDSVQQMATGELKVNGQILPLVRVREEEDLEIFKETNGELEYEVSYQKERVPASEDSPIARVGEDELFVVGDNRDNSYDSRAYGCVSFSSVVGKVFW